MEKPNTTYPKLLVEKARRYQDRVAMREKYKGIWQEISWKTYLERVSHFSLGLLELGMQAGNHAAILGENCPEWVFADIAIQSLRGVSVGIYPTNSEEQVKYIINHSESRFVVVGDQEQADKILAIKDDLPLLKKIVVIDMKGMRYYEDPIIISFRDVETMGRKAHRQNPHKFETLVAQTKPEDVAFIIYTSGTTGPPKGCMIPHQNHIYNIYGMNDIFQFSDQDSVVSYLPLCHILERGVSVCIPLIAGYTVNFAESIDTVQENIREISPTFFAAVPRILEKMHSAVNIKLQDTTRFKRFMFRFWEPVGKRVAEYRMAKKRILWLWWLLYGLAYLCIFRTLRDKMGLLTCRLLMSGGAPIAPEILTFFHSLGVYAIEMWALTESCGGGTGPHHEIKPGSVGQPIHSIRLQLAEDGEILIHEDSAFSGYYRDPDATNEVLKNGWLHTGDVGCYDEDGHLYIIDRKKDIIITSGGKNISPSEIENKMKCSPYIKEAIVLGDRRKFLSALIQLEYDNVGNWAQNHKIPYTNYKSLARNPAVYELIKQEVDKVNETLARVETVKKFLILEKELDQDDEELTATQKVKRKVIAERFCKEIEKIYASG
ncbi:MAG: AMP-binding protein [Desulfobacterales bacterium]|nr:MAG: AMP-binding protein [Desulfobacterales bacterium]